MTLFRRIAIAFWQIQSPLVLITGYESSWLLTMKFLQSQAAERLWYTYHCWVAPEPSATRSHPYYKPHKDNVIEMATSGRLVADADPRWGHQPFAGDKLHCQSGTMKDLCTCSAFLLVNWWCCIDEHFDAVMIWIIYIILYNYTYIYIYSCQLRCHTRHTPNYSKAGHFH